MTKTDIVNALMEITHEMTGEIETIDIDSHTDRQTYSASDVMDIINHYAEELIELRLKI